MQSRQAGRVAWIVAVGVLALAVAIWLVASGERTETSAPAPPSRDETAEPTPELPEPAEAQPLVSAIDPASEAPPPAPATALAAPTADSVPSAQLRVLVVDPASRPLEGARVLRSRFKLPLHTDAEGIAVFEVLPGETLRVAATHPDFRLATGSVTIDGQPGSLTDLRLQLGEGLQVCLEVHARDGRPIEGACVRIREGWGIADSKEVNPLGPENVRLGDDLDLLSGELREERETDGQGRCCVSGIRSGPTTVHVDASGFVPVRSQRFDVDADGGDLGVVVLEPAARLIGIAEDTAGPVPEARVTYRSLGFGHTTTDADGSFVVDGQPSAPTRVELHVAHSLRGQFYDEDITLGEQPVHVTLVPDLDVTFELIDARSRQPVDGEARVEFAVPQGFLVSLFRPRTLPVSGGRLELLDLGHFVQKLTLRVEDYDRIEVTMATLVADADRVLELELTRPVTLLVRVHAAGSGELLSSARLCATQDFRAPADGTTQRNFTLEGVRFDNLAGGFLVAESDLGITTSDEVRLWAQAQGYTTSEPTPIAANGRRTCADTIDLYLERE